MGIVSKRPGTATEYDAQKGIKYEAVKKSSYMTDKDIGELPWLERINWLSFWIIFGPLLGFLVTFPFVSLNYKTALLGLAQYFLCGFGITAGYHRLWSHKAFRANIIVETVLALWGAAAFEGSARWWARAHRAHHRFVDTEKDPYAVHKGFWHAHLGWMVFKQDQREAGRVDISDLNAIPLLQFQHRYYLCIATTIGFALPMAIAHFGWNDIWGGLVYAGFLRMTLLHQATFCINSLAHTIGEQSFSTEHTSYDSVVTALVTFGEGYHNFHHEFPHDYRNGTKWFHYDPTKWLIWSCSALGAAWGLRAIPDNEIEKARVQVLEKNLEQRKEKVDWGVPPSNLATMTWKDIETMQAGNEKTVVVLDGIVYDVTEFMARHPGGRGIITFWKGRDASMAFNGEIYKHSKAARNLLPHLSIGKLVEQLE